MDYHLGICPLCFSSQPVTIDRIFFTQVVEYIAFQLLSNYEEDTGIKNIVDTQDFYIFPVVNPDGG